MLINAIGMYEFYSDKSSRMIFKQVDMVPIEKNFFFPSNRLEEAEKLFSSDLVKKLKQTMVNTICTSDEIIYLYLVPNKNSIIAVSLKSSLGKSELYYLLKNLEYLSKNNNICSYTLNNIFINPCGFTGGCIYEKQRHEEIKKEVELLRKTLLHNIEKLISNLDSAQSLRNKAIKLENTSIKFNKKAKQVNRCC